MRYGLPILLMLAAPAAAQTQLPPLSSPAPVAQEEAAQYPAVPAPPRYMDARLRDIPYDENAVVQLAVAPGRQMAVIFGSGERVQSVAVGDSGSWQVTASKSGDSLFVKPTTGFGATNMTVITDARTYLFDLTTGTGADSVYLVRFRYDDVPVIGAERPGDEAAQAPIERGTYKLGGTRALRPDAIEDDGQKTYIAWGERKAMPAVFAIGPAGEEMLVDGYVREGVYTIDRVYRKLIFRFDNKTATAQRR